MTRNDDELEILSLISTQYASKTHAPSGAVVDKSNVTALAAAHEHGNLERVLTGYHSSATASGGAIRDKRLWTEIAKLTGAQGNSTSLFGTPEQVVDALLDYYDLAITKFLFRGFDPLEDAIDYGRNLLPLFREAVAKRKNPRVAATG